MKNLTYSNRHLMPVILLTAFLVLLSTIILVFLSLTYFKFPTSISLSLGSMLVGFIGLRYLFKVTNIAFRNEMVFVKKPFEKTKLAPAENVKIHKIFDTKLIKVFSVKFFLDGSRESLFCFSKVELLK